MLATPQYPRILRHVETRLEWVVSSLLETYDNGSKEYDEREYKGYGRHVEVLNHYLLKL